MFHVKHDWVTHVLSRRLSLFTSLRAKGAGEWRRLLDRLGSHGRGGCSCSCRTVGAHVCGRIRILEIVWATGLGRRKDGLPTLTEWLRHEARRPQAVTRRVIPRLTKQSLAQSLRTSPAVSQSRACIAFCVAGVRRRTEGPQPALRARLGLFPSVSRREL